MVVSVGTRDLKNGLTRYLRLVSGGTRVLVTSHGRPVAELVPVGQAADGDAMEAWLARLAETGQLKAPAAGGLPTFRTVRVRGRPLSRTVVEDRR